MASEIDTGHAAMYDYDVYIEWRDDAGTIWWSHFTYPQTESRRTVAEKAVNSLFSGSHGGFHQVVIRVQRCGESLDTSRQIKMGDLSWGNFIINGVRFDGPQEHYMACSIYRDATENKPGSGGYKCDCSYKHDREQILKWAARSSEEY